MNPEETHKKIREISDKKNAAVLCFIDRVVTLSSSMLVLSIAFRSSILGASATEVWLLKLAWAALAVSSVCGAFLHLAAASAGRRLLVRLQANHDEFAAAAHPIYTFLYVLLVVSFPVGIVALMGFGIINTHCSHIPVVIPPITEEGEKAINSPAHEALSHWFFRHDGMVADGCSRGKKRWRG